MANAHFLNACRMRPMRVPKKVNVQSKLQKTEAHFPRTTQCASTSNDTRAEKGGMRLHPGQRPRQTPRRLTKPAANIVP